MVASKINILHLRASEGGGGGPEKTIFKTSLQIDTHRFWHGVCYLRKFNFDLGAIASRYHEHSLPYFEFPGNKVDPRQLRNIVALIKRHRVHILHTHESKTVIYGVLLKFLVPKLILVTTLHGWILRRRRSMVYQWLAEIALRVYDAVVVVSDDLGKRVCKKGIRRVVRIHNAIDLNDWPLVWNSPKPAEHPYTVGYIGRISQEKGPAQFLEVSRILSHLDDEIQFIMVGEGPLLSWVEAEIQRLNLVHRFSLTGYVSPPEITTLYGKLDLLLSTSHTEGMPNTILEALASGVPVVATRVGGVAELITHGYNGLLTDDGDIIGLVREILNLKNLSHQAARFSRNGRAHIQAKFSFPRRVAAMENLYRSLTLRGPQ